MDGSQSPSAYCEQCGNALFPGDTFCAACGTRVPEPPAQDAPTQDLGTREPGTREMPAAPSGGPLGPGRAAGGPLGPGRESGGAREAAPAAAVSDDQESSGGLWIPVAVLATAVVLLLASGTIAYTLLGDELSAILPGGDDPDTPTSQNGDGGLEGGGLVTEPTTVIEPTIEEPTVEETTVLPEETTTLEPPPEDEVEAAVRGHYEAIGDGDFEEAYSYFGPGYTADVSEEEWVADEESYDIQGSTIYSVDVEEVSGSEAGATVDVGFEDNTGTPRFDISWDLVEEDGGWKLDEVTDSEEDGAEDLSNLSPSETQELHYEYLNSAQYEEAYEFFAEESQNVISLDEYSSAFDSTYEVSEYSVNSEQINGGTATIEADLSLTGTQRGDQQYPITQEFVREDGEWRLIMRDNQVEAIADSQ